MPADKCYANYLFIKIDLDGLEHAKDNKFLVFKIISMSKISWIHLKNFPLKNIKLGEELLIVKLF
jgi:hypothetical protein